MVADVLDRDGLLRAVDGHRADAVIHELTTLGKPPRRHRDMALTNLLRTEGTANLLAAADALGARRFLTQSIIFGTRALLARRGLPEAKGGVPGWALRLAAPYVASFAVGTSMRGRQRQGQGRARLAVGATYRAGIAAMVAGPAGRERRRV